MCGMRRDRQARDEQGVMKDDTSKARDRFLKMSEALLFRFKRTEHTNIRGKNNQFWTKKGWKLMFELGMWHQVCCSLFQQWVYPLD